MSTNVLHKNFFAVLKEVSLDSDHEVSVAQAKGDETAQPTEVNEQPTKQDRVFSKRQIEHYKQRQIDREAKIAKEIADAAIKVAEAEKKQIAAAKKVAKKTFTREETAQFEARVARRAGQTVYTPEEIAAYEARVARRAGQKIYTAEERAARREKIAAECAAFAERQLERAKQHALFEERQQRRAAGKAEFEARAAKREDKAKKFWMTQCLQHNRCFNCGEEDHRSNECPQAPFEGSYIL